MNSFYEHHRDSVHRYYRCFDRILLDGIVAAAGEGGRAVSGGGAHLLGPTAAGRRHCHSRRSAGRRAGERE
jgi:hypothetical protein